MSLVVNLPVAEEGVSWQPEIPGGGAGIYLVTWEPLVSIGWVDVSGDLRPGGTLHVVAEVRRPDGRRLRATVPVLVELTDATGRPSEHNGPAVAVRGRFAQTFRLADNEPSGAWRVRITELASGHTAEREVTVQ